MDASKIPMVPTEALRKLSQLHAVLNLESQERAFDSDELLQSDLAGLLLSNNQIDHTKLIPFLVTAVNHLAERVQKLESARKN
jgi:hypothetical protein